MADVPGPSNELIIGGVKVNFPCKPYPSQLCMMSRIVKGLQNGSHCLLESPTGSGKSLALLCSALAWQADMQAKLKEESANDCEEGCNANISTDSAKDFENKTNAKSKAASDSKTSNEVKVPTIYFGTRTHKQIAQITHELARTAYKSVNMTILSSREHSCIHPVNQLSKNKNDGCRDLLKGRHSELPGSHCAFYQNVHRMRTHNALYSCGLTKAWDLEELVQLGRRLKACPYYSCRELKTTASIVFCPYNYLIDNGIRGQMGIDLKDQVVILDEAHNIEDSAREAASNTLDEMELINTIADLDHLIAEDIRVEQHKPLHLLCTKIGQWLQRSSSNLDETGYETWSKVWSGQDFISSLNEWGINADTLPILQKGYKEALETDPENEEEPVLMHSTSQAVLGGLFLVLSYLLFGENFAKDYRIAIMKQAEYGVPPPKRTRDGWISLNKRASKYFSVKLHFWCLNPAVAFSEFGATRCVILTSGTLSPMSSFSSELGLSFPIQLEASHVIADSQVWVGTVGSGPNGHHLQATYQNTNSFNFQDELGKVVLSVCSVVPYGVLCFFSSYKMLEKLCERWKNTGLWNDICQKKAILSEPHGRNKSSFEEVLQTFYQYVLCEDGSDLTGALLLAVCRGKVSEGLDFSDNNARAVITVGIPFPNFKDCQVELKRKYNDEHSRSRGLLSGSEWYEIQAFRALNQALGRCIRHKNDWGALIIVDDRFCKNPKRYCKGLSKWVRQKIKTYHAFTSVQKSLVSFCDKQKSGHSNVDSVVANISSSVSIMDSFSTSTLNHSSSVLNSSAASFQPQWNTSYNNLTNTPSFNNTAKTPNNETTQQFAEEKQNTPKVPRMFLRQKNSFDFRSQKKEIEDKLPATVEDNSDEVIIIPSTPEKTETVLVIPESPEDSDFEDDDFKPATISTSKRKSSAAHTGSSIFTQQSAKKCKQSINFDSEIWEKTFEKSVGDDRNEPHVNTRRRSLRVNRKDEMKKLMKDEEDTTPCFTCGHCHQRVFVYQDKPDVVDNQFKYIEERFKCKSLYALDQLPDTLQSNVEKTFAKANKIVLDSVWSCNDKIAFQFYHCVSCKNPVIFHPLNSTKYSKFYVIHSQVSLNCSAKKGID